MRAKVLACMCVFVCVSKCLYDVKCVLLILIHTLTLTTPQKKKSITSNLHTMINLNELWNFVKCINRKWKRMCANLSAFIILINISLHRTKWRSQWVKYINWNQVIKKKPIIENEVQHSKTFDNPILKPHFPPPFTQTQSFFPSSHLLLENKRKRT